MAPPTPESPRPESARPEPTRHESPHPEVGAPAPAPRRAYDTAEEPFVVRTVAPDPLILPKIGRQIPRPADLIPDDPAPVLVGKAVGLVVVLAISLAAARLSPEAQITLTVFGVAVWLWVFSSLNDTYVALGAAVTLVVANVITAEEFFAPLGDDTTWLLIGAFILSAAVSQSGLALRATAALSHGITRPRVLVHTLAFATTLTAFAVPATSGRAALVLPVLLALAAVFGEADQWLTRVLGLMLPTVVLFTAAASLIGAGAHLITLQILKANDLAVIGFSGWMMYGLPYALLMAHISAEIILRMFSTRPQRRRRLSITMEDFGDTVRGPLSSTQQRSLTILAIAVLLWFSEAVHGIDPAIVAIIAALLITSPGFGTLDLKDAVKKVQWNLLLFMAATIAISQGLMASGAADVIASGLLGSAHPVLYVVAVIVVSSLAHLIIQSRSARSAVLIPLIVATAAAAGINPVAAAFISTVAAGMCHTLPSSAKPLAIFSDVEGVRTFTTTELLKTAVVLLPCHLLVMALFAWFIWPALGLPLHL